MKIRLESNFKLLGSCNIDGIDFNCTQMPVKDLLQMLSDRSTKSPQYINEEGTDTANLFQVQINGRGLGFCEKGINTLLKDGDTVAIYANTHDG